MKIYSLNSTQFLPIAPEVAWEFFSLPENLLKITPPHMKLKILSVSGGKKIHNGQVMRYKVAAIPGIYITWVTEITEVCEPNAFVDDQRSGPFALWIHRHSYKGVPGGTEMTDELQYAVPLGWLGRLANALFVGRQVKRIFDYRYRLLETYFDNAK